MFVVHLVEKAREAARPAIDAEHEADLLREEHEGGGVLLGDDHAHQRERGGEREVELGVNASVGRHRAAAVEEHEDVLVLLPGVLAGHRTVEPRRLLPVDVAVLVAWEVLAQRVELGRQAALLKGVRAETPLERLA